MDDILNKANIPQYLWAYCSIENDVIKTPDTEVLYQNGLATEQEYLEWQSKQIDNCLPIPKTNEELTTEVDSVNSFIEELLFDILPNLIQGGEL